jgi:hypothetical protein
MQSPSRRVIEAVYKNKEIIFLLAILILAANLFTIFFIRRENFIYYWDYSNYWTKFVYLSEHFFRDTLNTIKTLIHSIRHDDYNYLPAFLLMPFGFLFGTSRLAYILSIVNIFALPATLSFVVLHKKFTQSYGVNLKTLISISFATIVLLPSFWEPILGGLPDVGGIILINIVLLLYISHPFSEQSILNLLLIALFIPALVLFRRWYAFWGLSFYLTVLLETCVTQLFMRASNIRNFIKTLAKLFMQISVSAVFLFSVAPNFIKHVIRTDYADIFSAYRSNNPMSQSFIQLLSRFGLFYLSLFVLGAIVGVMNKKTRNFSLFLILQSLVIFILFSRTQNFDPQHFYLLIPTMLLFSSLFISRLFIKPNRFKPFFVSGIALVLILIFLFTFSQKDFWPTKAFPKIFAGFRHPPLVRNDIKEIDSMLNALNGLLTEPNDRVYVLASSHIINSSILDSAYLSLNRHKQIAKKILWTHDVDKRDGFPQELLTAKYVIVADPIQYHLNPQDQRVVGIPAEFILKGQNIGKSFMKLPYDFVLDNGVHVYIYKKINPLNYSDLAFLSKILKYYYPDRKYVYEIRMEKINGHN